MKKLSFCNILSILILIILVSCGTQNRKMQESKSSEISTSKTGTVTHDSVNSKVEIRHQSADQKKTDSIKDEINRKKK